MATLREAFAEKNSVSMMRIHSLEFQFRMALLEPDINESNLAQQRSQINKLKEEIDAAVNENLIAVAKVLTPEQRAKMRMALMRLELDPAGF
jgi:Spy/CpxP family protein refolding chaperone